MKLLGISTDDFHDPQMARAFTTRLASLLAGFVLAVTIGYWLGNGQTFYVSCLIAVAVVLLVTFGMQRKAWILIPLTCLLTGGLGKLPIPLSPRDVGIVLATVSYAAYRVTSHEYSRPKLHVLDLLIGLNVIYLGLNLYKNPVGFLIFGSHSIGGRPIVNICLALMAYWVIIRLPDTVTSVARIPYYILVSGAVLSGLSLLVFVVPSLTPAVTSWYAGLDTSAYFKMRTGALGIERLNGMMYFGLQLFFLLCAYYSPATLFDPRRGRFYALLLASASILAAGFRNLILWAMMAVAIGGWLHRRWRELALAGIFGALLLGALAFGQGRLYDLPEAVQRSLTFLPGNWSSAVVTDAEQSSTFRFKIWRSVIEWGLIKDWWLGDGFGVNLEDLAATYEGGRGQYSDFLILTGAFHSGPLTAIRYVGIYGLVLVYLLSLSAAYYSYRCVNECRGTPLFPAAVFFAIQLIWGPVHYTLIFGAYEVYLPDLIFQIACLRLLFRMSDELKQRAVAKSKLIPMQSIANVPA